MRWWAQTVVTLAALAAGSVVADQAIWTLRGSPIHLVDVQVFTAMELKNHKEDYGPAETQTVRCQVLLFPFPASGGWSRPCWWLERRREVINRY